MNLEILLFVACLPIIVMCTYIYKKDNDKEPSKILRKLFIFGSISIVPIIFLEYTISKIVILDRVNYISLFINIFITISLIEEGVKWVTVNKSVFNDIEFNHAYDAIIYSVFVSLGFALIENINYVLRSGVVVGLLRAVTTIPAHTFTGIIMGYFLGKSKQEDINKNEKNAKKYMFLSLFIPILCHTLYDYFTFIESNTASILFLIMVIVMYIISVIIVHKISILNKNFDGTKYDSKERNLVISDSSLFLDTLIKVLVITLILIVIYAGVIFL